MRIHRVTLSIFVILMNGSIEGVQIKCYDCITPIGEYDLVDYCNSSLYCKGTYCTKGPDAQSNGILHGCSDNPPLDSSGSTCKWVTSKTGVHSNCFCKNVDFCNLTTGITPILTIIIVLIIRVFHFLN